MIVLLLLYAQLAGAVTITTIGSGNWSSTTPGAPWPGGTLPASTDDVVVGTGFTLTVDGGYSINSITVNNGSTLFVNGTFTLAITASITFPSLAGTNTTGFLAGLGTINAASLTAGTNISPTAILTTVLTSTISNLSLTGNLTVHSSRTGPDKNDCTFNHQSGTITIGGSLTTSNAQLEHFNLYNVHRCRLW